MDAVLAVVEAFVNSEFEAAVVVVWTARLLGLLAQVGGVRLVVPTELSFP